VRRWKTKKRQPETNASPKKQSKPTIAFENAIHSKKNRTNRENKMNSNER
jgi:hypothetical protein